MAPVGPRKPPNGSLPPRMTSMGEQKMQTIAAQNHGPVTIGIDVSKAVLDVHLHPEGLRSRFANDACGHGLLVSWAASQQPERVIFEGEGTAITEPGSGRWKRLWARLGCPWSKACRCESGGLPLRKRGSIRCRPAALPRPAAPGSRPTRWMRKCWRGWPRACSQT